MAAQFDPLEYFDDLKAVGVSEDQARAQVRFFRNFSDSQKENAEKYMATKADVAEINARAHATELRLQKEIESVRLEIKNVEARLQKEIESVRLEIKNVEARLQKEIESVRLEIKNVEARLQTGIDSARLEIRNVEIRLLLWQGGFGVALAAIMAKGFGWIGF